MSRKVCKNCGSTVEQGIGGRWLHIPSRDPRCLVYAEPFSPFGTPVEFPDDAQDGCGCHRCNPQYHGMRMFLCPQCGNKRCPKATFHGLECSGSNAPGQVGSRYA